MTPSGRPRGWLGCGGWRLAALVTLLVAGAAPRLHALGRAELWGDEILFLRMCHPGLSPAGVIAEHMDTYSLIGHLPAAALISNLGMRLEGLRAIGDVTPVSARMPSVVLGVATLIVLAAWGFRLTGTGDGTLAIAAVAGFSYVHIWYSREAYHYSGQLFFASLVLLAFTAIVTDARGGRRLVGWGAIFAGSSLGLAFSHPSGGALLGALSAIAIGVAFAGRRRETRLYGLALVGATIAILPVLLAGTGQAKGPCVDVLRFPAWVVAEDVLENLGLGPGLVRASVTASALAAGAWLVARRGPSPVRFLLAGAPAVFLLDYILGRSLPHFVRYYLLLWPFIVWLIAEAVLGVARRAGRFRHVVLGAAVVLLAASVAPGLGYLYALEGKPNRYAAMAEFLDRRLPPGTIVVWDGDHALRFIPGFYAPAKPMLYGSLPDWSPAAYMSGQVERSLQRLRASFPASAFVEWSGMNKYCARCLVGRAVDPMTFERRLRALFPATETFVDAAYDRAARAGWSVVGGVPRFAADRAAREASDIAWSMNVYYDPGISRPGTFTPVFSEADWQLDFNAAGQPAVLAEGPAALTLTPAGAAGVPGAEVDVTLVGLRPGRLTVAPEGAPVMAVDFHAEGEVGRVTLRPGAGPLEVRFAFQGGGDAGSGPSFGVVSVVSRPSRPSDP